MWGGLRHSLKKNDLEVLLDNEMSDSASVFINFNYDTLLLLKIVEFFNKIYEDTPNPRKAEWRVNTGYNFENRFQNCARDIFHPHGILNLFDKNRIRIGNETFCYPTSKTFLNAKTSGENQPVTSWNSGGNNAISCHDAKEHFTFADIKKRINNLAGRGQESSEMRLILLGVGPDSLAFNLDKIFGEEAFDVRQVHYTCTKEDEKHIYEQYFNRFEATIERYEKCKELVEKKHFHSV